MPEKAEVERITVDFNAHNMTALATVMKARGSTSKVAAIRASVELDARIVEGLQSGRELCWRNPDGTLVGIIIVI